MMTAAHLDITASLLKSGILVALPTEGVWGIHGRADWKTVSDQLYQIKRRALNKNWIVLAGSPEQVQPWLLPIQPAEWDFLLSDWMSRPTTWLLPANTSAPPWLVSQDQLLAVRISPRDDLRQICHQLETPIISTSANFSGKPSACSIQACQNYFPNLAYPYFTSDCLSGLTSQLKRWPDRVTISRPNQNPN